MIKDKGNGRNSERDEWETPQDLFDKINKQYNFTFDCCSNGRNNKCISWTSNFEMYVTAGVKHIHWMNPPFSKAKIMFQHFFKVIDKGVAIYRCDNLETKVWQQMILPNASWIFFPNKRTEYKGLSNKWDRPVFASALIGLNTDPPKGIDGFTLIPEIRKR